MEINAATVCWGSGSPSVLNLAQAIWQSKNLCFRCLKPTLPFTHTGSLDFPNQGVTSEQREAFVAKHCHPSTTAVAEVGIASPPVDPTDPPLTYRAPSDQDSSPEEVDLLNQVDPKAQVLGNYQGFEKFYEEFDAIKDIPVATVHVRLDCSKKGCLLVSALFKRMEGVWEAANILVNMGAMANFIRKEFV